MKHCIVCGEPKHTTEYHKNKNNPDGLHNKCKSCVSDEMSERYYWKTNNNESYSTFHFNRKKFIEEKFPNVNYRSFTSHVTRNEDFKLSDLSREDLIKAVEYWLSIKRG